MHQLEVLRQVLDADVLDHLQAGDAVVLVARDGAVVEALDARLVGEARLGDAGVAEGRLLLGNGDARRLRAEVLRRVHGEGSPPAADVEHLVARADHELAAHEVEFVVLRLLDGLGLVAEEARRVDHALAEEGLEEVVAAVVVLADDARVLRLGVDGHLGDHPGDEELQVVARERELDEAVARVEKRFHVGDVDVAVEVRFE